MHNLSAKCIGKNFKLIAVAVGEEDNALTRISGQTDKQTGGQMDKRTSGHG